MNERTMIGADEATKALVGKDITSVEFVTGQTEDEDYIVIRVGDITIYADSPSVYTSKPSFS